MIYIIDTYAWIEYLIGSKRGECIRELIDNAGNKLITLECCLAELRGYSLKHNSDFEKMLLILKSNSVILPVLTKHWLAAAKIRFEFRKKIPHFGLVDAILIAKQKELKCRIVTGDPHFKTLKNIVYVGE